MQSADPRPELVLAGLAEAAEEKLRTRWSRTSSLLSTMCHYALVPSGKLFRPILLLESACAVGGSAEMVLPAAVGAECGHVASLIHDDIIDGDELRRGRRSVHSRFGAGNAIVAGDALIFDLFAGLAECRWTGVPDSRVAAALEAVARCGLDLCRGQSMEEELCRGLRFDLDSYLTMIRLKTAAFFQGACESGAILAGGTPEEVEALSRYALALGTAFQIQDDILGYTNTTEEMGKDNTSDSRNGRLTLPVILAYRNGGHPERRLLRQALTGEEDLGHRHELILDILDRTGALAAASKMAWHYAEASGTALLRLPPSPSRDRLALFGQLAIDRDR
ncbi:MULTISPECIES: polyprenyl synthetase family protein [unclassified Crossiella]|uniref:polyprenyl synthetase family protein n=1 Tax=unclassified Crossiella TaxID=2620835 RepID=UPI001FFF8AC5|nr:MULTISPECIES: polyprenyl synthetase family protein [unclassified Crossiella]MCK2239284.1 polyprenyl synthetase family protein [Crossiella sp. S99.2]MCK2251146.1 polyprenyl synthetase family protein [Crossiella sp. S99.1]